MEPLKYYNHVKTTTRSYYLGCNFVLRRDLQPKEPKKIEKRNHSFSPSFIFKEGSLEEISLDFQEVQKPRIRGTNTYWKCIKCGPVCQNSMCWEILHRAIIPKEKKRKRDEIS